MQKRAKGMDSDKRTKLLFYICLLVLPLTQFLIFYVYVNFNSFVLAFESYDVFTNTSKFVGFDNFEKIFNDLFVNGSFNIMFKNSLTAWIWTMFVGIPFSILFSNYIYKKGPLSNTFKTFLYMPQVISSVVLVIIFKYLSELGIPSLWKSITGETIEGLYTNKETAFQTVLFFSIWAGFGTQVLMYLSSMSGIDLSISEAAKIDGVNYIQELWFVTIPMIFPTITTFILVGIAGIFNNQVNLYSFGGPSVPGEIETLGYYMYMQLQQNSTNVTAWPKLSALALMFTFFVAPVTFFVRWLLNKYGPKVD